MKSILILLATLAVYASAQREESLSVVDSLKRVQPAYQELQNFVVRTISNAKLNSSQAIFDFNGDIILTKETFLRSAIQRESEALYQINGQDASVDGSCLGFLRSSLDINLNIAGVSFTNCINDVDSRLKSEISAIYTELNVNESSIVDFSIYDVFRGQNIFVNPQAIILQLQDKLAQLQNAPNGLVYELSHLVDEFRARLDTVRDVYTQCLTSNDQLLASVINNVYLQLQLICQGELVAVTSPTVPETTATETTIAIDETTASSSGSSETTTEGEPATEETDAPTTTFAPTETTAAVYARPSQATPDEVYSG